MPKSNIHYKDPLSHNWLMCGQLPNHLEYTTLISKTTCPHCLYGLQSRGYIKHNSDKEFLTWDTFGRAIKKLAESIRSHKNYPKLKRVYGIPRGGVIVALALAHELDLEFNLEPVRSDDAGVSDLLIVDDIVDSGKTISKYGNLMTAALYLNVENVRKRPVIHIYETDKFVQFPWETKYTAKIDYLEAKDDNGN